jgi:flagellar assembly factor FliW
LKSRNNASQESQIRFKRGLKFAENQRKMNLKKIRERNGRWKEVDDGGR